MLRHPALLARHHAGNPESKTLFPEQRVSTVARTHAPDQFLLRKVDNVPPRGIQVAQRMQSGDKLVRSSQPVHGYFAHTRHDPHARHHVWAVRDFHADFADRRAHWSHHIRHYIHCSAAHCSVQQRAHLMLRSVRVHPVVRGSGFVLLGRADERQVLGPRHVIWAAAMQVAIRIGFLAQRQ